MSTGNLKRAIGQKERLAIRQEQALRLRLDGLSHSEIGERLGIDRSQITRDLQKVMKATAKRTEETAEQLRSIELQRLDLGIASIADKVRAGDPRALDLWLRYSESRRRLLGLDQQQQTTALIGEGAGLVFNIIEAQRPARFVESTATTPGDAIVESFAPALPAPTEGSATNG
ncbi:sigma factor-like helix-turn-helix DNA-binding protein [Humisphaera borealis]|uniref:RNA polymerase sigma factor 70 region 4 type 2 domain-containing protein n=1 Tax=Humisphaera borealis TaxID=2807512 RepID=A0A7M2WZZ7_9BACT|nr:sigma factor-like helix-turn-helix DNA-binding protein [Humisphaera borealis]QOV91068.1 hypothetical protein IPV69_06830 [Humisphaera borealis]